MITLKRNGVNASGTSLQGFIESDYATLVRLFGSPDPRAGSPQRISTSRARPASGASSPPR